MLVSIMYLCLIRKSILEFNLPLSPNHFLSSKMKDDKMKFLCFEIWFN